MHSYYARLTHYELIQLRLYATPGALPQEGESVWDERTITLG
jgi:hypothetical protein